MLREYRDCKCVGGPGWYAVLKRLRVRYALYSTARRSQNPKSSKITLRAVVKLNVPLCTRRYPAEGGLSQAVEEAQHRLGRRV